MNGAPTKSAMLLATVLQVVACQPDTQGKPEAQPDGKIEYLQDRVKRVCGAAVEVEVGDNDAGRAILFVREGVSEWQRQCAFHEFNPNRFAPPSDLPSNQAQKLR
ncbi:hypothetical protein HYW83_02440 [Candidatus Peregrinibacteria bacterium]|nr:hypothetical protein [Candidatus Peregrinibacteria bacterium]